VLRGAGIIQPVVGVIPVIHPRSRRNPVVIRGHQAAFERIHGRPEAVAAWATTVGLPGAKGAKKLWPHDEYLLCLVDRVRTGLMPASMKLTSAEASTWIMGIDRLTGQRKRKNLAGLLSVPGHKLPSFWWPAPPAAGSMELSRG
jgi:hypothetical protein